MNDEEIKPEETKEEMTLDSDLLNTLVKAGENKEGMVSFDKKEQEEKKKENNEEPLFKEVSEKAVLKTGKVKEKLGKYAERLLFDIKSNPKKYMLDTPRGKMSIEEALKLGYDPATKDFTDETPDQMIDKRLKGLSQSGKDKIKQLMNPQSARVPQAEAETMGIPEGSPMIEAEQPQEGQAPNVSPEMLEALGGGQ